MFRVEIAFDDFYISSIEKEDLVYVQKWINSQKDIDESFNKKPLPFKDFVERFLEYYVSENEVFLKIKKGDSLIGIFKGRMEFKNFNELLIWYFIIDSDHRGEGLGTRILNEIIKHFSVNLNIDCFSSMVMEDNEKALNFWRENGFEFIRISRDFFQVEQEQKSMIILRKIVNLVAV